MRFSAMKDKNSSQNRYDGTDIVLAVKKIFPVLSVNYRLNSHSEVLLLLNCLLL